MKTKSTKSKATKIETPQTEETVVQQAVESAPAVSEPQFTDPETNHLVGLLRMNTEDMTEAQLFSLRNQIAIMLSDMAMSRAREIRSKVELVA